MNSSLVESVKRIGFRKWYERQLLSSHAHMVLAFLSAIGLMASVEAHGTAQGATQAADLLFMIVCAAIGLWALRRYIFLLMRAEETCLITRSLTAETHLELEISRAPTPAGELVQAN